VRGSWGRNITTAVAVVFGLALFWVYMSIDSITDSNIHSAAELVIPIFEPGDEEPTVNRLEDDTPKPVLLLPAPTETPPLEPTEIATNPQASEAVEAAMQKPFAEAAGLSSDPVLPAAESPSFESPTSENTPVLSQEDPAQPPVDLYADEMLVPVSPQTTSPDSPTDTPTSQQPSPEPLTTDTGTSQQPPPPDLPADAGTPPQPPVSPDEITSYSDLPADSSPYMEDTAYLE
jgi:hypothetical protein